MAEAELEQKAAQEVWRNNGPPAQTNWLALLEALLPAAKQLQSAGLKTPPEAGAATPPNIDACRLEGFSSPDLKKTVFHHHWAETTALVTSAAFRIGGSYAPRGTAPA